MIKQFKINKAIYAAALSICAGCASAPLTKQEKSIKVLNKSDAPANCEEIGEVTVPGLMTFSETARKEDLKRATYKAGGNLVTIDRVDENQTIFGTAYKCSFAKR